MRDLLKYKVPKAFDLTKVLQADVGVQLNPITVAIVIGFFEGIVYDTSNMTIKRGPRGTAISLTFPNGDRIQSEQPSLSEAMLDVIGLLKERE